MLLAGATGGHVRRLYGLTEAEARVVAKLTQKTGTGSHLVRLALFGCAALHESSI
jgi:hypothetical protein